MTFNHIKQENWIKELIDNLAKLKMFYVEK